MKSTAVVPSRDKHFKAVAHAPFQQPGYQFSTFMFCNEATLSLLIQQESLLGEA